VLADVLATMGAFGRSGGEVCQRDVYAPDPLIQASHAAARSLNHCDISAFIICSLIIRHLL
jgi:hypothetical protein